jgi:hypothetical protein
VKKVKETTMFTKFLVAAAALTAAAVATAPAQAKTNIDVNVGLGFGGGYGGGYDGYYGGGYGYYPVYGGGYDGISCWKAKKIVQNHGFYKVNATDCGGKIMRFKAKKSGDWYRVKINRWGNIVDVDPL